ncbi:Phage tail sheath protein subtilisin-like domain protein [compost metagenome]
MSAGSITVSGAPTAAGTLNLYLGGERVQVGIQPGKTPAQIATALVAAINANTRQPLVAAVDGSDTAKVDLTCRWKGETGNTISVLPSYFVGDLVPAGVVLTIVQPTGGTGNPDVADAIAVMGDDWWNAVAMPYTDAANLTTVKQELLNRWGPLRALDGLAYTAFRGTHAETGTFGNLHNNQLLTVMGTNLAASPPYLWAAVNAIVATQALNDDPARPLKTLPLQGLLPATREKQWTLEERNLLLYDGISTHTVDREGRVLIERQVTTYQDNSAGLPDPSYLDVTTPATLGYFRYANRVRITQKFPRCKLAPDGTRFGPGQPIVTPKIVRAELLALYRELEAAGLVTNYSDYAASLLVWIDENDPNRLNVHGQPNLVNGFNIMAMKAAFIL